MQNLTATQIASFITGLLVLGALTLFLLLRNSTNSTLELNDLEQIGDGMLVAFQNVNYNFGNAAIPGSVLINGGKIPSTIVSGTNIQSRWNTPITLTGTGTAFTAALTNVPQANCVDIETDAGLAQYLSAVVVTGGASRVPPVPVTTASTDCAAGNNTMTLTYTGHP
jgi:hypothetical protein